MQHKGYGFYIFLKPKFLLDILILYLGLYFDTKIYNYLPLTFSEDFTSIVSDSDIHKIN